MQTCLTLVISVKKNVNYNQKALKCTKCDMWIHIKCNDISIKEYDDMIEQNKIPF